MQSSSQSKNWSNTDIVMDLIKENRCRHGVCEIKRYTSAAKGCEFSLTIDLSLSDDEIEA